jgi:hypothetical protein
VSCWINSNYKRSIEYSTKYRGQKREKIQALSLAKDCYSMKLDLLTNATVVDDAIRFVSQKSRERIKSSSNGNEDQLEEEQEEQIGEMTTINQVF